MEKEYTFCLDKGHEKKDIVVKESELSKPQKDLLSARITEVWNNIPNELKRKFINELAASLPEDHQLQPNIKKISDGLGK